MDGKLKRLKNLPQNRGKSEAELQSIQDSVDDVDADIELLIKFKDPKERRLAKILLDKYLAEFQIDSISDRNTLAQVIFLEVNQLRIQAKLNEIYGKDAHAIPSELLETMNKNSDVLIKMKNTLGLSKAKSQLQGYDALQHLMKRHEKWRSENQVSRVLKCPHDHCQQYIWLKIRTDVWEAKKHPFFQDNFLNNRALMDNYGKTVLIDRDFLAAVFGVSPDYIDPWLVNKIRGPVPDTNIEGTTHGQGQEETSGQKEGQVIDGSGTPTATDHN